MIVMIKFVMPLKLRVSTNRVYIVAIVWLELCHNSLFIVKIRQSLSIVTEGMWFNFLL